MRHEKNTRYNMIARIGAIICMSIIIVDSNNKVLTTMCGISIGMSIMLIIDSVLIHFKAKR